MYLNPDPKESVWVAKDISAKPDEYFEVSYCSDPNHSAFKTGKFGSLKAGPALSSIK